MLEITLAIASFWDVIDEMSEQEGAPLVLAAIRMVEVESDVEGEIGADGRRASL
jgi:hypothetical protein